MQFAINGTSYGSPATLSGGVATISDSALAASGTAYTVTAAYSGDTDFASSTGRSSGGQTVNPATTTTTTIGSGFYYSYGVAVDAAGDVFVADTDINTVRRS